MGRSNKRCRTFSTTVCGHLDSIWLGEKREGKKTENYVLIISRRSHCGSICLSEWQGGKTQSHWLYSRVTCCYDPVYRIWSKSKGRTIKRFIQIWPWTSVVGVSQTSDEYLKPQLHTQLNRGIIGSQCQLGIILRIIIWDFWFPIDPELSFFKSAFWLLHYSSLISHFIFGCRQCCSPLSWKVYVVYFPLDDITLGNSDIYATFVFFINTEASASYG